MTYIEYRVHDVNTDTPWHLTAFTHRAGVGLTTRGRGAASIVVNPADLRAFAQWVLATFPAVTE